jgi:hypothetical protein
MAEMLLINPRRRRKAAKSTKRRARRSTRRRNPVALAGRPARSRISGLSRRRRRNPIANLRGFGRRRRRNPISLGGANMKNVAAMFKDAAIGGAGALAMDLVMGQLNGFLPATFQTSRTTVGIGDAVKAGVTAILGRALAKSTKGLSVKAAQGALAVQAYEILSYFMPATMTIGGAMGYASPAAIVQGSNRVGPTRGGMLQGFGAYTKPGGRSPLLNAYVAPGKTVMLSGRSVQQREGVTTYK